MRIAIDIIKFRSYILMRGIIISFVLGLSSVGVHGQGCTDNGEFGLSASTTDGSSTSSGCPKAINYSFNSGGMQVVSNPSWNIVSGSGLISSSSVNSITVTWSGGGTGIIRVTYPVRMPDNTVQAFCSSKSYVINSSNAGTISETGPLSFCNSGTGSFNHTGSTAGTVTWQRCTSGCSSNSDDGWSAQSGNTFNVSESTSFRVKLTGTCGDAYSNVKRITIEPSPSAGSMFFVQGSSQVPHNGGTVQFELTGYSSNANSINWEQLLPNGTWQTVSGGFISGQYRSAVHTVTSNTTFRAIAKSSSSLGCESQPWQIASQNVTLSTPPPPPPSPYVNGPASICRNTFYTYSLQDANYDVGLFQTSWIITGSYETSTGSTGNLHSINIKWTGGTTGSVQVQYHNSQYTGTTGAISVSMPPVPTITLSNNNVCSEESVTLNSTGGSLIRFEWANLNSNEWTQLSTNSPSLYVDLKFRAIVGVPGCGTEPTSHKVVSVEARPSTGNIIFIQGSSMLPSTGGSVQFELTGYSPNANLINWERLLPEGNWQSLYGGFIYGQHRSETHFVSSNTLFRARAKSTSSLGCESTSSGVSAQQVNIASSPPPSYNPHLSGPESNVCTEKFHTYNLTDPNYNLAGLFQISWQITGSNYEINPTSGDNLTSIQVKWLSGTQGTVTVSYYRDAQNTGTKVLNVSLRPPGNITIDPTEAIVCLGKNIQLTANGGSGYQWSGPGILNASENQVTVAPMENSVYTVTGIEPSCQLTKSATKTVTVLATPEIPSATSITYCEWQNKILQVGFPNASTYNWYDPNGTLVGTGITKEVHIYEPGSFNYLVEAVDDSGCISPDRGTVNLNVTTECEDKLNWIETIGYNHNPANPSSPVIISHSKSYFDYTGAPLQSQYRDLSRNVVLASQGIADKYNRLVIHTLPAPINVSTLKYEYRFVTDNLGHPYNHSKLDQPVGTSATGTLGWYYSTNNNIEENVPITEYPYSRTEFYDDGTGEIRRSAGVGEVLRLGSGHEVLSGTFPVFGELDDYLSKRPVAITNIVQDGSLANEAVQNIVRDENGKYGISITDKTGKTVLSCRAGTQNDNVLAVNNSILSSGNPSSSNYRLMTYFYILNEQPVTITGSNDFVVENLVTNERKNPGATFAQANGKWPSGFYRVLLTNTSSEITVNYVNYFLDVSYQFYDDAGRLRTSVSPNGYNAWKSGTGYQLIDKTTYEYNHQGWLLKQAEPDAGITRYVYSKDGKIRFSQNSEQKKNSRLSYTHYDKLGRPVESGEYIGSIPFVPMDSTIFTGSPMHSELEKTFDQVAWLPGERKDWIKTHYDVPMPLDSNIPSSFVQEFVRGAVSCAENENSKTWYSYDELGRLKWSAQKPTALGRAFVTTYAYDFLGNVQTVKNLCYVQQAVFSPFTFNHFYQYDANKRLSKVFTSTDDSNQKLRATYEYYLHGPLKRIELGDNIQGIDFVYNIQGWLTQINHPDKSRDPGGDTNDVFGMVLDYYESAVSGLLQTSSIEDINNPIKFHRLPKLDESRSSLSYKPSVNSFKDDLRSSLQQIKELMLQENGNSKKESTRKEG